MQILYEDNHLLVVVKPPNLPVQADASGDDDLLSRAKRYIKEKYAKPGEVYLGLVHRLDRPVGGVMVFARTSKAAARLTSQFKSHTTEKCYAALTAGNAPARARLEDSILKTEAPSSSRVRGAFSKLVPADTVGAQSAALSYVRAAQHGGLSLLDVRLYTGRHHQIRVQLAGHGMPLYGDQRYNAAAEVGEQLALWAYSLSFEHPTLHTRLRFTALPEGGAWMSFSRELAAMAQGVYLAYEDENLLAAIKPSGLETAAADAKEGGDSLEARLCALCGTKVFPVHRLDANTTGLVLFAKTPAAEAALLEAIRARQIHKLYRCIVKGCPTPPSATLRAWLTKDAKAARVHISDAETLGAKPIETAYRMITEQTPFPGGCELEVELFTGRTHQIRAQLAHISHPLLGDDKYGARDWNRLCKAQSLYLCAAQLSFSLPRESMLHYLNEKTFRAVPFWAQP